MKKVASQRKRGTGQDEVKGAKGKPFREREG